MEYLGIQPLYISIGVECNERDILATINGPEPNTNYYSTYKSPVETHRLTYSSIPTIRNHKRKLNLDQLKELNLTNKDTFSKPKVIANVGSKCHRKNLTVKNMTNSHIYDSYKEKILKLSVFNSYKKTNMNAIDFKNTNWFSDNSNKNFYKAFASIKPIQSTMSIMHLLNKNEDRSVFDNLMDIRINSRNKITIDCFKQRILLNNTHKKTNITSSI